MTAMLIQPRVRRVRTESTLARVPRLDWLLPMMRLALANSWAMMIVVDDCTI